MMDYHELINELSYEDNPYVLDYIDDAVEMLEHLHSELAAANARCETLSKMVTQYQDELIPGYRERAEKAERERDAAVGSWRGFCSKCAWNGKQYLSDWKMDSRCRTCRDNGKCNWQWCGPQEEEKT